MKHTIAYHISKSLLAAALLAVGGATVFFPNLAQAKDVEYSNGEISVRVNPGEPTSIEFPGQISGGYKKKPSQITIDRKNNSMVLFANGQLPETGEAILVRLDDGRSYSLRILSSNADEPRDDMIRITDSRSASILGSEEEDPRYLDKNFEYAPPSQVAGLMREMVLVSEFGKKGASGYRISDEYRGQMVLNDGTVEAKIDKIFIGPNLWGYVIDAKNVLAQTQKLNPASFRIDGTRAISMKNTELSPIPLNIEQQISNKHETKVYIVARARKSK